MKADVEKSVRHFLYRESRTGPAAPVRTPPPADATAIQAQANSSAPARPRGLTLTWMPLRGPAKRQLAQVDYRHRSAAIVDESRNTNRRLWDPRDLQQRQNFHYLRRIESVTLTAYSKLQEQHRRHSGFGYSLKRETLACRPTDTSINPSTATVEWRSDSTVCCAASLSCVSA